MRKALLSFVVICLLSPLAAAQTKNLFAIVVDSESYTNCKTEIEAYRTAVSETGPDAVVLARDWESPEEIRDTLLHLYKNSRLEGAVFVGDIPIPMIRRAQHMASAFKMDEDRYPMRDSSIPSDRFYDDFDLKFEFIGRDSVETAFHYYSLAPESLQYIECDIYSGRIKPSDKFSDKYEELSAYLRKVIRLKKEKNRADRITSYSGSGSFSNSLIAWKDETVTISEQFPETGKDGKGAKFLAFAMYPVMKEILIDEIKRDDLDIVLFHEHGVPDRQYLTNTPFEPSDYSDWLSSAYELGKYYAREAYRTSIRRGSTAEEAARSLTERYGIDSTWFCDAFDPEMEKADSVFDLKTGIILEDIDEADPNVRIAIFDACYNGDFREADCIANRYIMSDGNAVVGIGNSVNVLQDKSSSDLLGMLAAGYSVGEWMQQVNIIESHILGDPTFRFESSYDFERPVLKNTDCKYWLKYLDSKYPCDIQGLALHKLYNLGYEGLPDILEKTYGDSPYFMLRLQCMHLLAHYKGDRYASLLEDAMDDPYEFIRRKAAYFAGKVGSERLIEPLAQMYLNEYNAHRVTFNIVSGGSKFPDGKFAETVKEEIEDSPFIFDKASFAEEISRSLASASGMAEEVRKVLTGQSDASPSWRRLYISTLRNNPYPHLAEDCLALVCNGSEETETRIAVAEALGWFVYSHNREMIVERLQACLESGEITDEALRDEITKTVGRLSDYLR